MPMEENSTQTILSVITPNEPMTYEPVKAGESGADAPRQSTIEFIRSFARCYVAVPSLPAGLNGMILN